MTQFVIVIDDHMLDWHFCQICYPLEIKLLLLLLLLTNTCLKQGYRYHELRKAFFSSKFYIT